MDGMTWYHGMGSPGTTESPAHDELLGGVLQSSLCLERDTWRLAVEGTWIYATPLNAPPLQPQGWKLHISATITFAVTVLARILPVLKRHRCPFKLARSLRHLAQLNAPNVPGGVAGKFVTIYPRDDQQAREIASECHAATLGLQGPYILSDRRLKPDSLVHYRYGSFANYRTAFSLDGLLVHYIEDPDGRIVPDERKPWYTPPSWVTDPFVPAQASVPTTSERLPPEDGLRLGVYLVKSALKQGNRGGTYRARSLANSARVVLKEARPHVGVDRWGRDVTDRLRHEFTMLGYLAHSSIVPVPIDLFIADDHVFIAMQEISGTTLRQFILKEYLRDNMLINNDASYGPIPRVASLLHTLHSYNIVVRDFNPNNIMVRDNGELVLVDLELAWPLFSPQPPFTGTTLGYTSPQHDADIPLSANMG